MAACNRGVYLDTVPTGTEKWWHPIVSAIVVTVSTEKFRRKIYDLRKIVTSMTYTTSTAS